MRNASKTEVIDIILLQDLLKYQIIFSSISKKDGVILYWNDSELSVEPYHKNEKVYYCGKKLLTFSCERTLMYSILVLDYEDCCCANVYSDGEIDILFESHSSVPHKMKVGGQSAKRFAQIRENEITSWFKDIDNKLKSCGFDEKSLYLGMSKIYYNRFYNTLHTYNKSKIRDRIDSSYSNRSGIYDMINTLEYRTRLRTL